MAARRPPADLAAALCGKARRGIPDAELAAARRSSRGWKSKTENRLRPLWPRAAADRPDPAIQFPRPGPPIGRWSVRPGRAAGCPPASPRLELATTRRADGRPGVSAVGTAGQRPPDTFNSSGAYGAAKLWPAGHFAALARRIVDELDHHVLVMCGPNEQATAGPGLPWPRPQVVSMRPALGHRHGQGAASAAVG